MYVCGVGVGKEEKGEKDFMSALTQPSRIAGSMEGCASTPEARAFPSALDGGRGLRNWGSQGS